MGTKEMLAVLPMALFALACGGSSKPQPKDAALSDDLRSDLARAAAPTSDLASSRFRPEQVVSSIELGNAPAPHASSKKAQHPHRARRAKPAPKPTVETVAATTTEPSPAPTVVTVTPAPAPTAGPRPMPNPVPYPSGSGSEPQDGGGIGAIGRVIGVIIRGGSIGDDDHCEIRPGSRHGGGVPISVNQRIPMPMPMGHSTFPRGGW